MTRTAALVIWSTVVAVGCTGAAVVLLGAGGSTGALVRALDPDAPVRLAQSSPTAPVGAASARAPENSASATAPGKPAAPGGNPSAARPAGATPTSVRIDPIGLAAPVRPVGVDVRGDVAIPEAVGTVGWYRYSAPPGSAAGSTVLVGHVDSAVQGEGAFFRLRDLDRGDRVVLGVAGGERLTYQVVSRAQFPKSAVPLADLFSLAGRPRLTLITCGGTFDATVRSYADNVVITAVPL